MVTRAVNNPGNFTIGPTVIKYANYGESEAQANEVGLTQGGVSYNHTMEFKEYDDADQHIGVVGAEKTGDRLEVTFRMKEATLENLMLAWGLPDENLDEASNTLTFGGDYDIDYKTLFLEGPAPAGGVAKWEFWKAMAISSSEITDQKEDNTVYEVTFLIIEDTTKTKHQRYGQRVDTYDDTTAPTIDSVSPTDSATDVAVDTTVEWTFSEAIQQRDITTGNFNLTDGAGAEVAGSLSYDPDTYTVVFTPDASLANATDYLTFVSGEVRDMAGNEMGDNYRTTFTTIA